MGPPGERVAPPRGRAPVARAGPQRPRSMTSTYLEEHDELLEVQVLQLVGPGQQKGGQDVHQKLSEPRSVGTCQGKVGVGRWMMEHGEGVLSGVAHRR